MDRFRHADIRKHKRSRAEWRVVASTTKEVFIEDLNRGRVSVTNDAEAVVEEVLSRFGTRRVIYRDTEGRWDELVHDGTKFLRFAPYRGDHP